MLSLMRLTNSSRSDLFLAQLNRIEFTRNTINRIEYEIIFTFTHTLRKNVQFKQRGDRRLNEITICANRELNGCKQKVAEREMEHNNSIISHTSTSSNFNAFCFTERIRYFENI